MYNSNQYYADNHLIGTPKDSILDGNKDNINIHYPGPQVLGWAACKCPLHCPGPSLLKAASRLSPHYPRQIRRGVGAQGGGGQVPAPYGPSRVHLYNTLISFA